MIPHLPKPSALSLKKLLNIISQQDSLSTVEEGLRKTVQWYLENQDWWQPLLSPEYQSYYQQVYAC